MTDKSPEEMASALSLLLHQKIGVKSGGLEAKVASAGRRLPKRIRRLAMVVVEAEKVSANPKLARQIDHHALDKAYYEVESYLNDIDVAERRKTKLINFFGLLSFNLLAVGGLLLWYLVSQGYL